jgi:hypothetical protein
VKYAFSLNPNQQKGIWEGDVRVVWFTASLKRSGR